MFRKSILTLTLVIGSFNANVLAAQTPAATFSDSAPKTSLTVSLTGIRNDKGQVFIQLWTKPDGFPKQGDKVYKFVAIDASKAVNGTVTTTFTDLAPGTYAVSTLHDENRNGKMDSNMLGIPKEGWAISNNIVTHTHAPSFEQASFQIPAGGQRISIELHY
jgi:uncharacterized protein (DUF2141 family)